MSNINNKNTFYKTSNNFVPGSFNKSKTIKKYLRKRRNHFFNQAFICK